MVKKNIRLIARLDIKGENLIKSINLEGIRVVGNPHEHALLYYQDGADELIYMDMVASLYGRNNLQEVVSQTVKDIFIPLTVGGGIRSVSDAEQLLRAGADKIAINTAATQNPNLITDISKRFGSQCVVLSIEAKYKENGKWEAYTDCGRELSGLDAIEWAKKGVDLGAGEILLTSIDREGTCSGFDIELTHLVSKAVPVPVIASGGFGQSSHLNAVINDANADAVAFADTLHYKKNSVRDLRTMAFESNISVRQFK